MKAYLIDPFAKTVTEVEHDGNYREIYKLIDAETFDVARLTNGDGIYVDDEGLFKDEQAWFKHLGYGQPLAGKALVLGSDSEGNSCDPTCTLADTQALVQFGWPLNIAGRLAWIPA